MGKLKFNTASTEVKLTFQNMDKLNIETGSTVKEF